MYAYSMTEDSMVTKKKINISLHPIELLKLDRIADEYGETRSGMLTRIIQEFPEKDHKDTRTLADVKELNYKIGGSQGAKKRKKSPTEYEDIDEIGDLSRK